MKFIKISWFKQLLLFLSIILNFYLIYVLNSWGTQKLILSSYTPIGNWHTEYLAHGVVAFKDKEKQPKDTYQILTFYMDMESKDIYADEAFMMGKVLTFMGRNKFEILSFDKNTGTIVLNGFGWKKIIIDSYNKKVIEATDESGDITYLKSSYEI